MKFKDILLATDGHSSTTDTIDIGLELALIYGARLHIISIVDTTLIIKTGGDHPKLYYELKRTAKQAIEHVIKEIGDKKIEIIKHTPEGKPAEEILNYAKNNKIDIIIMGTSQKKGFEKFLLGSAAEFVMRKSNIPVYIVPDKY